MTNPNIPELTGVQRAAVLLLSLGEQDAAEVLKHMNAKEVQKLGIAMGETTADGLFTLQQSECLGACADSPVMLVNDRTMCSFMSADKLDQLVDGLRKAEQQ